MFPEQAEKISSLVMCEVCRVKEVSMFIKVTLDFSVCEFCSD